MKKAFSLIIILLLAGIMIVTFVKNQVEKEKFIQKDELGQEVGIKKGQLAPNFTLKTLDGKEITLSELKGKKVVLNFWATWCSPCKKEMPHLQKYYEKHAKKENVEIVAVNLTYNSQTVEQVQEFANSYKLTFPIPLLEDPKIGQIYEIVSIPSTFIIDSKGIIQHQIVGPLDEAGIRNYISKID